MSFLIQYKCPKCGCKSPDGSNVLIDPWDMPELFICTCRNCKSIFQRKLEKGIPIDRCPNCGSANINIYENMHEVQCPQCGSENIPCECIGTCF